MAEVATVEVAPMEEVEEEVLCYVISVTALITVTFSAPFLNAIGHNTMEIQEVTQEVIR